MTIRAYLRISVDKEESQQIDQARYLIGRWAEYKHPGAEIVYYTDPGVSGRKPLRQRRGGCKLWRDLQRGDVLVVTRIDRLARNTRDLLDTIQHCEDVGATFVATEQDIDTSGPFGRFMLTLLAAVAELEAGIVSERVRAARAQLRRDGRHEAGRLPYGFRAVKNPDGKGYVVRPHPEEGPRLREAALAIISGATQISQAEKLGLKQVQISRLLRNPRLYGKTPGSDRKPDPEAAILSYAEFRALQKRLGGPKEWRHTDTLAPVFYCYRCDRRLYYVSNMDVYACGTRPYHPNRPVIARGIADTFLEQLFFEWYGEFPEYKLMGRIDEEVSERLAQVNIEIEEVTAKLSNRFDPDLVNRLQQLHRDREEIENTPVSQTLDFKPTGRTWGEAWAHSEDNDFRVYLAEMQGLKIVVHPARERHVPESSWTDSEGVHTRRGRFEVIELPR